MLSNNESDTDPYMNDDRDEMMGHEDGNEDDDTVSVGEGMGEIDDPPCSSDTVNVDAATNLSVKNDDDNKGVRKQKGTKRDRAEGESDDPVPIPFKRFRLIAKKVENNWKLPDEMAEYMKDNIETFIPEKDIQEGILEKDPIPTNIPKSKKFDEFLSPFVTTYNERLDMTLGKIESKILDILRPLSRVWKSLEDINNKPDDDEGPADIELEGLLSSIQKILIGQAANMTTYQRRLYTLSAICKDSNKAKVQLKDKAELFKDQEDLFGEKFRKHFTLLTKERNKSKELVKALGSKKESAWARHHWWWAIKEASPFQEGRNIQKTKLR